MARAPSGLPGPPAIWRGNGDNAHQPPFSIRPDRPSWEGEGSLHNHRRPSRAVVKDGRGESPMPERQTVDPSLFNKRAALPFELRLKDFEIAMQDVYDF